MNAFRQQFRGQVIPFFIVAMWAGMLWSRAVLSMAMIAYVAAALLVSGPAAAWKTVKEERGAWALLLLFLIPMLGFPWNEDRMGWWEALVMKAPFLALPFTMAALRDTPVPALRRAGAIIVGLTVVSAIITVATYMTDMADVNASYLRGAVMRVPMDNDHVRYGWALSLVYLLVLVDATRVKQSMVGLGKMTAWTILFLMGGFILLLSSRTGILGFLLANLLVLRTVASRRQRMGLVASLIILPLLAYVLFPSLRNRVSFMVWDFQNYSRNNYREGLNDAPRVTSWQAAADLISQRPLTGTGFGDIRPRMHEWYGLHRPEMPASEQLVPASEWLFHGVAAGIPGMLLFTLAIGLAYRRYNGGLIWKTAWWISIMGFLYETGLEVQHGIYLFAFFMTWMHSIEGREGIE